MMSEIVIKGACEVSTTIRYDLSKSLGETLGWLNNLVKNGAKNINVVIDIEEYPNAVFKLTAEQKKPERDIVIRM